MKVATWNVNSLRVRLPHVLKWLEREQPDLLALQETKIQDEDFPADAFRESATSPRSAARRPTTAWQSCRATPPSDVAYDIGGGYVDEQKRVLGATFGDAASPEPVRAERPERRLGQVRYKLELAGGAARAARATSSRATRALVVGDFNIAPDDRDVHDPAAWARQDPVLAGRARGARGLCELGLSDTFRLFPQPEKVFSWWDYRAGAFRRNQGLANRPRPRLGSIKSKVHGCRIDKEPRGWERPSDHVPVSRRIRCSVAAYVTCTIWATQRIS